MSHVVSRQPWGTVDIDTRTGVIFIQESWFYSWQILGARIPNWTYQEKRIFHNRLDQEIWGRWSSHFAIRVSGTSSFAHAFASKPLKLEYDIHWVLHGGNWHVNAYKVPRGASPSVYRSNVIFASRTINLYSLIFTPYEAANDAGATRRGFLAGPHEFGHTLENPDEYLRNSRYLSDTDSLMNIGHEVRVRHLHLILETLNTMIPRTEFHA